jgi:hypothetical protein
MRFFLHLMILLFVSSPAFAVNYTNVSGFELKSTVVSSALKFDISPDDVKTRIISGKTAQELIESTIQSPWTGEQGTFLFEMVNAASSKHLQIIMPNGRELILVITHDKVSPPAGFGDFFVFDLTQPQNECTEVAGRWGQDLTDGAVCVCMPSCEMSHCVSCPSSADDFIGPHPLDNLTLQDLDYGLVVFF